MASTGSKQEMYMQQVKDTFFISHNHQAVVKGCIKVTVHLQTDHFVEILIFRLMYRSKCELSSKKIYLKILNDAGEMAVLSFGRK